MLNKPLAIAAIAASLTTATLSERASANGDPALGALLGAGIGAAIGNSVNHHNGAWVGGAIGAIAGASIDRRQFGGYYGSGLWRLFVLRRFAGLLSGPIGLLRPAGGGLSSPAGLRCAVCDVPLPLPGLRPLWARRTTGGTATGTAMGGATDAVDRKAADTIGAATRCSAAMRTAGCGKRPRLQ